MRFPMSDDTANMQPVKHTVEGIVQSWPLFQQKQSVMFCMNGSENRHQRKSNKYINSETYIALTYDIFAHLFDCSLQKRSYE